MRGRWWLEQRTQDFPTHQRVNRHPAAQIEIERITLRQHDQRANMLSGQVEDRVGDLRQGFPVQRTPARQERYPANDGKPYSREDGAAPTHPEGALVKQICYQQDVKHALPVEVA